MSPAESFVVHELASSDVEGFRQLQACFAEAFDAAGMYLAKQPADAYLTALLGRDYFIALAALKDGDVVGGLAAYELEKFEQSRSEIYIYDVAVREGHRREGIATALIDHLRGIAARRGAYVIFVQADHGDDAAIALYSRMGRREDVLHFDIDPA